MEVVVEHGWLIIVALAVLGFAFVVGGLVALVRSGLRLKDRAVALGELEITETIDRALERIDRANARVDEIPAMIERAQSALLSIKASRERLQRQVQTATAAFNLARAIFSPKSR